MEKVIADPENDKHKPLIQAAFGEGADVSVIKANIEKLKTGNVPVKLPAVKGAVAYTVYDDTKNPMVAQHVEFGEQYHKCVTNAYPLCPFDVLTVHSFARCSSRYPNPRSLTCTRGHWRLYQG